MELGFLVRPVGKIDRKEQALGRIYKI